MLKLYIDHMMQLCKTYMRHVDLLSVDGENVTESWTESWSECVGIGWMSSCDHIPCMQLSFSLLAVVSRVARKKLSCTD